MLCVLLLCACLPVAHAASASVYVDHTQLTSSNSYPYNGSTGTAVWDPATNTLTLTDFTLISAEDRTAFLCTGSVGEEITIALVGVN